MADEKNKPEEEQDKKPDTPAEEKKDEPPKNDASEEKPEEKASDDKQADENGEGADAEDMPEESSKEETAPDVPQMSESDKLKAENLTLKTQLGAMKIGFAPECMEDAITLAEAIVKRDGTDISAALQAVAKKYPDWKSDYKDKGNGSGGFKVGADSSSDGKKADNDKLSQAFGIRKKK